MRLSLKLATAAACIYASSAAQADIVLGVIAPMTGQFASTGQAWKQAIDLNLKHYGDTVDGHKIKVIYRDLPESNPPKARALAQE